MYMRRKTKRRDKPSVTCDFCDHESGLFISCTAFQGTKEKFSVLVGKDINYFESKARLACYTW